MDTYWSLDYWFFEPNFWLACGLALIIIDVFLASFFLLPIGISALIMTVLMYFDTAQIWETSLFSTWRSVLIWFAALSVVSVFIIQVLVRLRRKDQTDINQY